MKAKEQERETRPKIATLFSDSTKQIKPQQFNLSKHFHHQNDQLLMKQNLYAEHIQEPSYFLIFLTNNPILNNLKPQILIFQIAVRRKLQSNDHGNQSHQILTAELKFLGNKELNFLVPNFEQRNNAQ